MSGNQIFLREDVVEQDNSLDEIQIQFKNNQNIERPKGFRAVLQRHKLLGLFYFYSPTHCRVYRCTLLFMVILGNMYFIGIFYDQSYKKNHENNDSGFLDMILEYNIRDFLIMIYSTIIMLILDIIVVTTLAENPISFDKEKDVALRVIRNNIKKRIIGLIICWLIMIYFCWSIGMLANKVFKNMSYIWIINTSVSVVTDLLFTSFIKIIIIEFIILRLSDAWKSYKEKKIKEKHESIDSEDRYIPNRLDN